MLIRRACAEDAEFIESTRIAAWKAAYRGVIPEAFLASLDPAKNLGRLRAALNADPPPFLVSVSEVQGEVVAFSILGRPRYETNQFTAELWALNVHPVHWRKGVGQRLVMKALADAKDQGFSSVELWCIRSNAAAHRLYEACGFEPDGRHRSTTALMGHPLEEMAFRNTL